MKRALLFAALALQLTATTAFSAEETAASTGKRAFSSDRENIDVFHLSKQPKLKKPANPVYPATAIDRGLQAEVTLLVDIDQNGEVTGAILTEPSASPGFGFEEASLEAAYSLQFEPAEIDDQPVAVQVYYKFKFRPPVRTQAPMVPDAGAAALGAVDGGASPDGATPMPPRGPVAILRGRLLERGTRTPMDAVTIILYREPEGDAGIDPQDSRELLSGAGGVFEFADLAPGRWTVLIEDSSYLPFKTSEDLRAGEAVSATFYLERQSSNPFDTVVTAVRTRKEVSRTIVDHTVIDKLPGVAGDPLAVVQNLAGVARVSLGTGSIIVRGSAPRDTRIYVGGMEIPTEYHFGGLRSVLPLAVVESIGFYPGNFSVTYGRGTGGIVDVTLKRLQPRRVGGYADVNLLDAGFFVEAPVGDHAMVALSARRSYVDALLKAFFPSDAAVGFNTAPRYYDYQLIAQYRPTRRHDARFMFFGSDDQLKLLFKQPADFDAQAGGNQFGLSTTFYRSLFTYAYTPSERISNTLRVSQGRNLLAFGIGVLSFDLNVYTSQVRDTVRYRFGDWLAWSVGGDMVFLRGDGTIALPSRQKEGQPPTNTDFQAIQRSTFSNYDSWSPAAFTELELRPLPSLLLVPGLRMDYFSRVGEFTVEPRFAVRQTVSKSLVLKAGVGLFHQEPDFGEDYPRFGNPDLTVEKAWHYSVGGEWRISQAISLDATLFYKSMYDLVSPTTATVTENGVVRPLIYDNGGRGRVLGGEMLLRHDLSDKLTGWIAYTVMRAERRDSGQDTWRLFDFDQTHILTALGSYKLGRNWTVGGRFRLVSGNPRTPITGSVVNASADRYEPLFGRVNSARNSSFHQLDLRVDKRWVFDKWILNTYLDVQNVYNHSNPEGLSYNYDYSQSKPQSGLPILTIFGVRAEL